MTTGVPVFEGEVARGIDEKDDGSSSLVTLLEIARRAKSYSPVPLGLDSVRIFVFALTHADGMYIRDALYLSIAGLPARMVQETLRSASRKFCAICALFRIIPFESTTTPLPLIERRLLPAGA